MASYCQYFFFWCVQNLIPLHLLQRHFGWVSAACLVKRGCCLWFWIEWERTRPLLPQSPGSAVSMFSSRSDGACFPVAEMLSSWLEVRFQILSLFPQCLAFPVSWLLVSPCSPGCFSQDITLHRELRYLVGLNFLAGAKEEWDMQKQTCASQHPLSVPCCSWQCWDMSSAVADCLSSHRVQREVKIVYTAPNVLLQML